MNVRRLFVGLLLALAVAGIATAALAFDPVVKPMCAPVDSLPCGGDE